MNKVIRKLFGRGGQAAAYMQGVYVPVRRSWRRRPLGDVIFTGRMTIFDSLEHRKEWIASTFSSMDLGYLFIDIIVLLNVRKRQHYGM
jgi:hypothetical protein